MNKTKNDQFILNSMHIYQYITTFPRKNEKKINTAQGKPKKNRFSNDEIEKSTISNEHFLFRIYTLKIC